MNVLRWNKLARKIKAFVDDPLMILAKGSILLLIGVSEASQTFRQDLVEGRLRVGHGIMIIGIFNIIDSLPHLIGSLEAWARYLDLRAKSTDEAERPVGEEVG